MPRQKRDKGSVECNIRKVLIFKKRKDPCAHVCAHVSAHLCAHLPAHVRTWQQVLIFRTLDEHVNFINLPEDKGKGRKKKKGKKKEL